MKMESFRGIKMAIFRSKKGCSASFFRPIKKLSDPSFPPLSSPSSPPPLEIKKLNEWHAVSKLIIREKLNSVSCSFLLCVFCLSRLFAVSVLVHFRLIFFRDLQNIYFNEVLFCVCFSSVLQCIKENVIVNAIRKKT